MSHYFETGFVVREKAWHGLAKVLQDVPTIEEGIKQAGLDWDVISCPIQAIMSDGATVLPNLRAIMRSTDKSLLGMASDEYFPLQNREAFDWFQPFIDSGACTLESAGSLKNGKYVWVLAKIKGQDAEITNGDKIYPYLLLSNAHDTSRAVMAAFTVIRPVCWNTLSAAIMKADQQLGTRSVRVIHTKDVKKNLTEVQAYVDLTARRMTAIVDQARKFQKVELDAGAFYKFLEDTYAAERQQMRKKLQGLYQVINDVLKPQNQKDVALEAAQKIEEQLSKPFKRTSTVAVITNLFDHGPGADMAGKTLWGAVQAVTHYEEHIRGRSNDSRLTSSWFNGSVECVREKAYEVAGSMV